MHSSSLLFWNDDNADLYASLSVVRNFKNQKIGNLNIESVNISVYGTYPFHLRTKFY